MQITYGPTVPVSPMWSETLSNLKISWCHVAWASQHGRELEVCLIVGPHNADLEYEDTSAPFWHAASQAAHDKRCQLVNLKVLWGLGDPSLFLKYSEDNPESWKVPVRTLLNIKGEPFGAYNGVLSKNNGERRVFWQK